MTYETFAEAYDRIAAHTQRRITDAFRKGDLSSLAEALNDKDILIAKAARSELERQAAEEHRILKDALRARTSEAMEANRLYVADERETHRKRMEAERFLRGKKAY